MTVRVVRTWAMPVLVLVGAAACGDGGGDPVGPVTASAVSVSPASVTLAPGQTASLSASVTDATGAALSRPVTWTSGDATVASVSPAGVVSGVRQGSTSISAVADGVVGSAQVTVTAPPVSRIDVRPATVSVEIGERIQLTATPRDAGGNLLAGRAVSWSTSDASVATVDANGLVTGRAQGSVDVAASAEGRTGTSAVSVFDPTAPRVDAVTPFPMIEGESATLFGVNFGATAGDNLVTVDGVDAAVTAASGTSITFTVPAFDCRPARSATLEVTAAGKRGRGAHPVEPATFAQVAVGDLLLSGAADGRCVQLPETQSRETYLVGVQSTSTDPSVLASVVLSGENGTGSAGPPPAAARPAPRTLDVTSFEALVLQRATSRLRQQREGHLDVLREERRRLRVARPTFDAARAGSLRGVIPEDVAVGDELPVRVPGVFPGGCSEFDEVTARVRRITDRGIWLEDVGNPSGGFTDSQWQAIATDFETRVAPALEGTFGPIPDTDGNGRTAFVATHQVNEKGWLSYANLFDYLPRAECAASNEGDWHYLATPDPTGQTASPFSATLLLDVMGFALAHDLTHVIQKRALLAGGDRPDAFIEEGQAGLGEEIYAFALTDAQPRSNYGASTMFSSVGNTPISPYTQFNGFVDYYGFQSVGSPKTSGAPEQCTWLFPSPSGEGFGPCGQSTGFGLSWAFIRWLNDHYALAAGGDLAFQSALIDGTGDGFERVETLTAVPIETLLARFAAMLYVDDRIEVVEPTLTFPGWDLFDLDQSIVDEARLLPRERTFTNVSESVSVRAGSSAYFLVGGTSGRPATSLKVRTASGSAPPDDVQLWIVRIQ